jgi:hypothetical protein
MTLILDFRLFGLYANSHCILKFSKGSRGKFGFGPSLISNATLWAKLIYAGVNMPRYSYALSARMSYEAKQHNLEEFSRFSVQNYSIIF